MECYPRNIYFSSSLVVENKTCLFHFVSRLESETLARDHKTPWPAGGHETVLAREEPPQDGENDGVLKH
ncbi:hypothetical protein Hamer_G024034 [Homarus americanus]|uniref:Uncharacterized protein n=1 Tax=Homarus americanus TaxID=6706 RepID=A0A8J5TJJ2_HOMAM|nr:hypothetical protein Hamer_G024034 [Homarus americanus]